MMQPNNGIFIATWYDDPQDTALFDLAPLLEELIATRARVPDILNKYRDQIPSWAGFGRWDLGDPGLDQQLDTPPQQRQQPDIQPLREAAPLQQTTYTGQGMTQMGLQGPAPLEAQQARVYGGASGPSPAYNPQPQHQQSPMTAPGQANSGYPEQQQARPQQTTLHKAQPTVGQPRVASAYSGIAGPYQAAQSLGAPRPAFSGVAGPYQAQMSRPARQ